jgi:hypothetical protein
MSSYPKFNDKEFDLLKKITSNTAEIVDGGGGGGTGDVTAAANFGTDNVLIRSNGVSKGVQATGITVDDSDNVDGINDLEAVTLTINNVVGVIPAANGGTGVANTGTVTASANLTVSSATVLDRQASTGLPVDLVVAASDETTALTTGTAKVTFRSPFAFTITSVRASLSTTQTGGSILTVNIKESGTTIFSTKLTIDNGEKTSTTAATPPVVSDAAIADDAEITIDIDQVGDGTAKGLKVTIKGYRT